MTEKQFHELLEDIRKPYYDMLEKLTLDEYHAYMYM